MTQRSQGVRHFVSIQTRAIFAHIGFGSCKICTYHFMNKGNHFADVSKMISIRAVLGLYMLVSKIIDSKFGTLADFSYLCPIETKKNIV